MRDNQFLSKINPIITFFVVLAVVLGATFLTLRWVESRKVPAAPVVQAPKADQAPQGEKKEQPAQESKNTQSENKQNEQKSAVNQQPTQTTANNENDPTSTDSIATTSSSNLPDTGLSLGSIFTFMIGTGITVYLSLTIRRQKIALRP